ncbi:very short patch repair endonuclease [Acidithiobacillus sp.]|jgi:DNA mismatch endonuclease (patch repair protein)|uniref:very short patch repair endonuclease n=1 Tax=Acidithiobacillus sp. TaxID=1872118 RepID=UPI0025C55A75|nr:DNA mismatch endonuclease Vsr [Acidithiobacillus sp.]MCK9189637.1 DNA mismatch endonuclease Vsr [Acidithiobacillus sp.]MCK9360101.1 DNA mismatch endonuclease Vsr [Acidithiobacillus sp.]
MVDIVNPENRSRMMAGVRGKDTKPEMIVRRALFAEGMRFRLHRRDLPGTPDVVLPSSRVVVFIHGCFWHRHSECRLAKLPTSNAAFWRNKLDVNVERDHRAVEALVSAGWRVLIIWECATRDKSIAPTLGMLARKWIEGSMTFGEIPISSPAHLSAFTRLNTS